MVKARHLIAFAGAALVGQASCAQVDSPATVPLYSVAHAEPDLKLERLFTQESGWTGGDAAYCVQLAPQLNLWLFGDSFIGSIRNGKRTRMDMVHNTAAWQVPSARSSQLHFFWNRNKDGVADLFAPEHSTHQYFWPGVPVSVGGKLVIFCKRIGVLPDGPPGFNFKWEGTDLLVVDNPQSPPTSWSSHTIPVPGAEAQIMPGAAAVTRDDTTYIFANIEKPGNSGHPCTLLRIRNSALAEGDTTQFQYWCRNPEAGAAGQNEYSWLNEPISPVVLFADAAPEFTVTRVTGLPGYFAVYSPAGLSKRICMRHADKPEGPWSEPITLYECTTNAPNELCYGAKNHPELADSPRTLVVSYSLNPVTMEGHRDHAFDYFPKFVRVVLKPPDTGEQL